MTKKGCAGQGHEQGDGGEELVAFAEGGDGGVFVGGGQEVAVALQLGRLQLEAALQRDVDWQEAVDHWYQTLYRPVIELVADSEIVDLRPDATATDSYLFTMDHLHALREQYGNPDIDPE